MGKRLTIIDIGSHKLEELSILLKPGKHQLLIFIKWSIQIFIKTIIRLKFQGILRKTGKYFELLHFYFFRSEKYDLQIISIEPNPYVVHDSMLHLKKKYPIHYLPLAILGHDSKTNVDIKKLNYYGHSRSSSIYVRGRPIYENKSLICVGMKFGVLWDQLIKEKIINEDDPFILRMNCEGSELGVISDCKDKNLKPICVIGSLGDVLKIHGREAEKKINKMLTEMGTPYYYFKGEVPDTWYGMIDIWYRHTDIFMDK